MGRGEKLKSSRESYAKGKGGQERGDSVSAKNVQRLQRPKLRKNNS